MKVRRHFPRNSWSQISCAGRRGRTSILPLFGFPITSVNERSVNLLRTRMNFQTPPPPPPAPRPWLFVFTVRNFALFCWESVYSNTQRSYQNKVSSHFSHSENAESSITCKTNQSSFSIQINIYSQTSDLAQPVLMEPSYNINWTKIQIILKYYKSPEYYHQLSCQ